MAEKIRHAAEAGIGKTDITASRLIELADKYGTPLLVTSEKRLEDNFSRLKDAFSKQYDDIAIKYAIKSNSNPVIIKMLSKLGAGMDASSVPEIQFAAAAGVPRDKIMFSPNFASVSELRYALDAGVMINFDDIGQFETLSRFGVPKSISFRLNPGFGKGEFPGITLSGPDSKFGIPESSILEAYGMAKKSGVRKFGMHMMCGSNVLEPEYFGLITSQILAAAGKLKEALGIKLDFIDIGGGFGVPYKPGESELDIGKTASIVAKEFKAGSAKYGLGNPQIMMEPGRYLIADTTVLLGTVNHVKSYQKIFVGTDIGMNLLLRPALYGAYHEIKVLTKLGEKPSMTANVVGEVCENTDAIARDRQLPQVQKDDVIAVLNAGAYVYGMSSNYNGRLRPAEVLVAKDGRDILIRRHETFEDLMGTIVPGSLGTNVRKD